MKMRGSPSHNAIRHKLSPMLRPMSPRRGLALSLVALSLAACGGADPSDVNNPGGTGSNKLAFAYFQKCVMPALVTPIAAPGGGTNTCASSGCHSSVNGTGGALRLIESASFIDLKDPNITLDQIRASDMYKNFYSALGVTIPGNPDQSRLLNKPLVRGILHGGGQILSTDQDPVALLIAYWIKNPAPSQGNQEFASGTYRMFTPADPDTGTCNTQ